MLTGEVDHDLETGTAVASFSGELWISTAQVIRSTILKCFVEHPRAVIVDLNQVDVRSGVALTVLPAVAKQSRSDEPVTLLVVVSAATEAGHVVRDILKPFMAVYENRECALDALLCGPLVPRRMHIHLPAELSSPAVARALIYYACGTWNLPELAPTAELIISELVANAVEHAGTDLDVTVVLTDRYLHLQVRDRSELGLTNPDDVSLPAIPAPRGRGLWMVGQLAAGWGVTRHAYGKVVWATLRLEHPPRKS